MIVWLLLANAVLITLANSAFTVVNKRVSDMARAEYRAKRLYGASAGCISITLVWVQVMLWVFYAIHVQDWRFAAIVVIPLVGNLITRAATAGGTK